MSYKERLIEHLQAMIEGRINEAEAAIASTYASRNEASRSSAGDKHEVGRAMIQQELDKQEAQLAQLHRLQQELRHVPLTGDLDHVAFGSLVSTDAGNYLVAIGLGQVKMEDTTCFVVSLASPIGKLLNGKRVGDEIHFNGRKIRISGIG